MSPSPISQIPMARRRRGGRVRYRRQPSDVPTISPPTPPALGPAGKPLGDHPGSGELRRVQQRPADRQRGGGRQHQRLQPEHGPLPRTAATSRTARRSPSKVCGTWNSATACRTAARPTSSSLTRGPTTRAMATGGLFGVILAAGDQRGNGRSNALPIAVLGQGSGAVLGGVHAPPATSPSPAPAARTPSAARPTAARQFRWLRRHPARSLECPIPGSAIRCSPTWKVRSRWHSDARQTRGPGEAAPSVRGRGFFLAAMVTLLLPRR